MNFTPKITYYELGSGTFKTVQFSTPPEKDPFNEELKATVKKLISNNGKEQVNFSYTTQTYDLEFKFETLAVTTAFKTFLTNHAYLGGTFKYYPSSDETDYQTFTIESNSVKFIRPVFEGSDFAYNFKFSINRVLDVEYDLGESMDILETQATIANNQSSAANVTGLAFDGTLVRGARVSYSVYRNSTDSGATELSEFGTMLLTYKSVAGTWELANQSVGDAGVTFTITSGGQVQYTSTNMTGSNYVGYVKFMASVIEVEA